MSEDSHDSNLYYRPMSFLRSAESKESPEQYHSETARILADLSQRRDSNFEYDYEHVTPEYAAANTSVNDVFSDEDRILLAAMKVTL